MTTVNTINLDTAFFEKFLVDADEVIFTEGQDTWVRKDEELSRSEVDSQPMPDLLDRLHEVTDASNWTELFEEGETVFDVATENGFYHAIYFMESATVLAVFMEAVPGSEIPAEFLSAVSNRTIQ